MQIDINPKRAVGQRNKMIYGHFIEHFHRQIYGGVFDPENPLSDEKGFRSDVIEALRQIQVPVLRWPGGCFVSSYHWKEAVGPDRTPMFDKAWRVEDSNRFGTDEFIEMCRLIGCEPYICTNAGTGTAEEMSDWVEYCNLPNEGKYAKWRIANGYPEPHAVRYWSIGNENYGSWELGAKEANEWSRLVCESAKLMHHVDPTTELSAAALTDLDWNIKLLKTSADYLGWISIHQYWDGIHEDNQCATYEQTMAYTENLGDSIDKVRGLLTAMGLEKKIKIAFDEWNLRGWYHPKSHTKKLGVTKEEYLTPRDDNDNNQLYTMADTIFTACFLNELNRNCDLVGMANFAPVVNTRGCIYTHPEGLVRRGTYHVFDLYVNQMGDMVLDAFVPDLPTMRVTGKDGRSTSVSAIDMVAAKFSDRPCYSLAIVNKDPYRAYDITIKIDGFSPEQMKISKVIADQVDAYNDIDHEGIKLIHGDWQTAVQSIVVDAHSVFVVQLK